MTSTAPRLALFVLLSQAAALLGAYLALDSPPSPPVELLAMLLVADIVVVALLARWLDDRWIQAPREADRLKLAKNIDSLETTNRELRAARDQVIHSARLASVGTLAAGIAHEVGNPLGAIIGFADVAKQRAERAGEDTELITSIRSEAGRIDRIVRGLLDHARPRSGASEVAAVQDVVSRVRDLLDSQGRLSDVSDEWLIRSGGTELVREPHQLEQVLVNLLVNALHAVSDAPDPTVHVSVEIEDGAMRRLPRSRRNDPPGINYLHRRRESADEEGVASVAAAERLIAIAITDNGHGVPEELTDQLFDPFFTTKEPGEGTGLGLSICARLVEGMGGVLDFSPGIGSGACFTIRLPMMYDVPDPPPEDTRS